MNFLFRTIFYMLRCFKLPKEHHAAHPYALTTIRIDVWPVVVFPPFAGDTRSYRRPQVALLGFNAQLEVSLWLPQMIVAE